MQERRLWNPATISEHEINCDGQELIRPRLTFYVSIKFWFFLSYNQD